MEKNHESQTYESTNSGEGNLIALYVELPAVIMRVITKFLRYRSKFLIFVSPTPFCPKVTKPLYVLTFHACLTKKKDYQYCRIKTWWRAPEPSHTAETFLGAP
jgi:hypothetical protein